MVSFPQQKIYITISYSLYQSKWSFGSKSNPLSGLSKDYVASPFCGPTSIRATSYFYLKSLDSLKKYLVSQKCRRFLSIDWHSNSIQYTCIQQTSVTLQFLDKIFQKVFINYIVTILYTAMVLKLYILYVSFCIIKLDFL